MPNKSKAPSKKPGASAPSRKAPGPKAKRLKIEGDWQDAVTKSFKKKKPPEGWPK
jgi:hypothetical protein